MRRRLARWVVAQPFPRFDLTLLGVVVAVGIICAVLL